MNVVISGASGLIGTALQAALRAAGHRPIALVRRAAGAGEISWDPAAGTIDAASLEGVDAVVHLAGAGINDHRWNDEYKKVLHDSRTGPTALLAATIADLAKPPAVFVSGSAIGYYGDRADEQLTEDSAPGDDFFAHLCVDWEAATARAVEAGIRVVAIRSGMVLSRKGGALKKQLPLFRFGLGGHFGSGNQWQSWISVDDEVGAIVHLLTADVRGPVNLTAPQPVTNREFTQTLARTLHRPAFFPIPTFAPKIVLGAELVDSVLLVSQLVLPRQLESSGFAFAYPELEPALHHLLQRAG
jgi:uncharacterized protein (TIGR01777 family)